MRHLARACVQHRRAKELTRLTPIPPRLGPPAAPVHRSLGSNQLSGRLPDLSQLTDISAMWLANNKLTGPITIPLEEFTFSCTEPPCCSLYSNNWDCPLSELAMSACNLTAADCGEEWQQGEKQAAAQKKAEEAAAAAAAAAAAGFLEGESEDGLDDPESESDPRPDEL